MILADKIATIRKSSGLSQEQLGELLGVSRQAVSKWENNQAKPDLDCIVKIAEYFNVSTDYLLKETAPAQNPGQVHASMEASRESSAPATGTGQSIEEIAAKNLRFKLGVFLTCLGVIFLIILYNIRADGIHFHLGNLYIYGFWGWIIRNKLALIGFIVSCLVLIGGIVICIKQVFNEDDKEKGKAIMNKFTAYLRANPKIVKIIILGYIVFAGCFTFPFGTKEFPLDFTKVYLVVASYGIIGLAFAGVYGAFKEKFVYLCTLALTAAGLICRYLLEFGEVSNIRNFTAFNIFSYILIVPIFTALGYHYIVKYLMKKAPIVYDEK